MSIAFRFTNVKAHAFIERDGRINAEHPKAQRIDIRLPRPVYHMVNGCRTKTLTLPLRRDLQLANIASLGSLVDTQQAHRVRIDDQLIAL